MSGSSYTLDQLAPLCKRFHEGEGKQTLERETGVTVQTISKYYPLWCAREGLEPRDPKIRSITMADIRQKYCPEIPKSAPFHKVPSKPIPVVNTAPGKRIAVIPDMQVKPGIDLSYCTRIGRYMADKKPDVIINIGDFADMPSLSVHDAVGSKRMEGARYEEDILSVQTGMRMMMTPIKEEMQRSGWNPRLVMTLGNHEDRITRALESTPKWEGRIGLSDLHYEEWGWETHPFKKPVVIENIAFCHYFPSGPKGLPIGTAKALLTKKHMSCIAGHQQGRDIAFGFRGDGTQIIGIIAGSCYEHDESYMGAHENQIQWRGLYILNDVIDGAFEENAVSLKYLRRKYA